ncbi:MAG: DUF3343 domain-containing protein [Oscillospiraceae bacterium]|nr:DUF3343 domain-containing protein [Oscillospiraceae bacterium]
MFQYYFTFRSITGAQRGLRALEGAGVRGAMTRAPKFLSVRGCGYALKVRDPDAAAAAFSYYRVPYEGAYRVDAHGGAAPL